MTYGICAGSSDKAERITVASIKAVDPDAKVVIMRGYSSIFKAYNEILSQVKEFPESDGVVLLHDDVELLAPLKQEVYELVKTPDVGVIGVIGGRNHPTMLWWGGGDASGWVEDNQSGVMDFSADTTEVDTVDGLLMIMTPAAIARLRFDVKTYGKSFHGYDSDICAQARANGLRVMVTNIPVKHHNKVDSPYGDKDMLDISDARYQLKWRNPSVSNRLRLRARIVYLLGSRRARLALKGKTRAW